MAILYKFLSYASALRVLESGQIKLSTLTDLNDLFDCAPKTRIGEGIETYENLFGADNFKKALQSDYAMICLTQNYVSPLLWGHYAESSKGFALGFESDSLPVTKKSRIIVKYQRERPEYVFTPASGVNSDKVLNEFQETFFGIKALEWAYEEEIRYMVSLESKKVRASQGMYFVDYPKASLKQILIGVNNRIDPYYLARFLNQNFPDQKIEILTAQVHSDKYEVQAVELGVNPLSFAFK